MTAEVELFLMRHGRVEMHQIKRFLGQTDTPLDDHGRAQARWWGECFAGRTFATVWSSDLCRSRETAELILESKVDVEARYGAGPGVGPGQVRALAALREIDLGEWDGRTMDEVRLVDPAGFEARGLDLAGFRPPGGESFADLQARVVPIVEEILARGGEHLVVGHLGVNRVLICHFLGLPLSRLMSVVQGYACLNRIVRRGHEYRLHLLNLTSDFLDRE